MRALRLAAMIIVHFSIAAPLRAQIPDEFTNLRFLPTDITRDSLLTIMRDFSFALGVRCQYCHVGGDGRSFEGVEFHKDDDPDKRKARFMLRLVANLNTQVFPLVPERDDPPVIIECKTCHRGQPRPLLLKQQMRLVIEQHGVDSAVAFYRTAREQLGTSGSYDFGEWETNVLAEGLKRDGRLEDAVAVYMLNAEYYPESISIQASLGSIFEQLGDVDNAVRHYERILEIRPNHRGAQAKLDSLRAG